MNGRRAGNSSERAGRGRAVYLAAGGPDVPTLVVHDERDPHVPIREGRAIAQAWPRAQLVATRGLGHHRILRDPVVIERAAVRKAS